MLETNRLKIDFFKNVKFLNSVSRYTQRVNEAINNSKLKSAASRINVPTEFEPYKRYIEKAINRPFPSNLKFNVKEVRDEDRFIIKLFSQENLGVSNINIEKLLKSAIHVSNEMCIRGKNSWKLYDAELSADRYPNNTSSGYPHFKRKDNDRARGDAIQWAKNNFTDPNFHDIMRQPTAVFHRFQYKVLDKLGSVMLKKKIRPVWGVPFRISIYEGIIFRDLLDVYEKDCANSKNPISSIGRTKLQISKDIILRLRSECRSDNKIVSVDYTKFDSTVPTYLWALFYACIRQCFTSNDLSDDNLNSLLSYHAYTPYCWNSTKLCFQRRGVPSGSLITSFFDTWVNRVIYHYALLESNNSSESLTDNCAYTLGDDLVFIDKYVSLNHLINVSKRFNMIIDRESCSIQNKQSEIDFLGYFWDSHNRPTQRLEWYIAHLVLPSRFLKVTTIPLPILQTYRGISICMSLYKGMNMFQFLVGHSDIIWKDLIERYIKGEDSLITYVGEDQRLKYLRIPLSIIFIEGWESL